MAWLKISAAVLVVAIVVILIIAALKPGSFSVKRSLAIKAAPEKIFPLINDFHSWNTWSPWEKLDPAMQRTFSGAQSGSGTVYAWQGNGKVGAGRMEISESVPSSRIVIKLDFIKPFEGHNVTTFTLQPQGELTNVSWVMEGPAPFISKVMQVFCNMDKVIGKDFETGLQNLKSTSEK